MVCSSIQNPSPPLQHFGLVAKNKNSQAGDSEHQIDRIGTMALLSLPL